MSSKYRTHKDVELKLDISFEKVLVIAITLLVTFVLPAQLITYFTTSADVENNEQVAFEESIDAPSESNSIPRVAGDSTTRASFQSEASTQFQINDESAPFFVLGGFFVVISLLILGLLFQSEKKPIVQVERDEFASKFEP